MAYGWIRDKIDLRDLCYSPPSPVVESLPNVCLSNGGYLPTVFDQLETNSCVGNAISTMVAATRKRENLLEQFLPSRLFVYYNGRTYSNSEDIDSGCQIRDGIKAVAKWGACSEDIWTFDTERINDKPSSQSYSEASNHRAIRYQRVSQDLDHIKSVIATGNLIVCGIAIFEEFEAERIEKTGLLDMPRDRSNCLGGHAVCLWGYDDEMESFLVRNSWGQDWGLTGNFWLPYEYATDRNLASDFWTITVSS